MWPLGPTPACSRTTSTRAKPRASRWFNKVLTLPGRGVQEGARDMLHVLHWQRGCFPYDTPRGAPEEKPTGIRSGDSFGNLLILAL